MYLLDTHILLWWLEDSAKLLPSAADLISQPTHQIWVSAVSIWEISYKSRLGKLEIPDEPLIEVIQKENLLLLEVQMEDFRLISRDPVMEKYGINVIKG